MDAKSPTMRRSDLDGAMPMDKSCESTYGSGL
jgi:hypothetical protein